ncbi:MAG TPA: preQ(1) synthase [Spirochaetota bacterium]|nr:preQ(1) synthase [Spirochaetota bacterium]
MANNELGQGNSYDLSKLHEVQDQKQLFVKFENPHQDMDYVITNTIQEFTAVCPVTGQPDFGVITIETIPDKWCIELKSLKMYMMSYRNRGIFHEAVTGKIAKDIIATIEPRWLKITGDFTVRGGIKTMVVFEHRAK